MAGLVAQTFTSYGPWNLPIGRNSEFSLPGVGAGYVVGLSSWEQPDEWSVPVYQATEHDPLRPVLYNIDAWNKVASGEWKRTGNSPAVEQQILQSSSGRFPTGGNVFSSQSTQGWLLPDDFNHVENPPQGPAQFRFPDEAEAAMGWDGHIAVHQPGGAVFEGYSVIHLSTGTRVALTYNVTDPRSNGDGRQNGTTASMLPAYGGLTTEDEVLSGHIGHAMKLYAPPAVLKPQFVYPALAFDRDAMRNAVPYSGEVPMGGRLALPSDLELDTLGLASPEGRTIAEAARTYGFIIADRGGSGFTVMVEQNRNDTALDSWSPQLASDLEKIFSKLHLVSGKPVIYADPTPQVARAAVRGDDKVVGTPASEHLYADRAGQTLVGNGGHDVFWVAGLKQVNIVAPRTGTTSLVSSACFVSLPANVDNLRMEDTCAGRVIRGNPGTNDIRAGEGEVTVFAGPGNDVIRLGKGKYTVTGGPGRDVFRFEASDSKGTVVTDFTIGEDRLDFGQALREAGYTGHDPVKEGVLRFHGSDGKVTVVLGGKGTAALRAHTLVTLDHLEGAALLANQDWLF